MKILRGTGFLFLLCVSTACGILGPTLPEAPGNLFIRQKAADLGSFKAAFQGQGKDLQKNGFLAYSLHRDSAQPDHFILTLKCSNLRKGTRFIGSKAFRGALEKAGVQNPVLWSGMDVVERKYENRPKPVGGLVIANNQVRSYAFWKACFDAEGRHNHANRGYQASRYSIHHLLGKPDRVLVVHEASDVKKAPAFMTSDHLKGAMEAMGVTGIDIWYGVNLEEGIF